jgi:GGDEF domain-containing protein
MGIVVGLSGLALGVAAAFSDAVTFAVLSAALALVGGVAIVRLAGSLGSAARANEELEHKVVELESTIEKEAKARGDIESQLASRIELTAVRTSTNTDTLTDASTGLYNEGYFTVALDARLAAARRNLKPVAVVLMEVIEGLGRGLPRPANATKVAVSICDTIREADTACRLMDGGYALVLEDTSENGAIWTVERIRRHMSGTTGGLTMWAGVACYPAHGFTTTEVLDRADMALDIAREWRQDRIEVASTE